MTEEVKFYSSKQLIENSNAKTVHMFFKQDSIKKNAHDFAYVKPICLKADGELNTNIDFNFNLNHNTLNLIKLHPQYPYWVICVDGSEVKTFTTRKGETYEYYNSETKYISNSKIIDKLIEIEAAKYSVVGYEGEL